MNAKLILTVKIEEIPEKVANILTEVSEKFDYVSKETFQSADEIKNDKDLLYNMQAIDQIRQKISLLDLNLEDCYSILKGYVNHKYNLKEEQDEVNLEQTQENTDVIEQG